MKLHILATRDIVANVYGQPIFTPHVGGAIRSFGDECKRKEPGNLLAQHPEDFELVYLGQYDDANATIDTTLGPQGETKDWNTPIQIAVGANYRD